MLSYPEFLILLQTFQLLSLFSFLGKILFVIEIMTPHGTALRWRAGSNAFNAAWTQLKKLWVRRIILCGKWYTLNDVLPKLQWCLLKRKRAVSSCSCHLALIFAAQFHLPYISSPHLFYFLSFPSPSRPLLFSPLSFVFLSLLSFSSLDKTLSPIGFANSLLFLTQGDQCYLAVSILRFHTVRLHFSKPFQM